MSFKAKLPSHCEIVQNVRLALQNRITKSIQLELNLSLISEKAPNLSPSVCCEMNTNILLQ